MSKLGALKLVAGKVVLRSMAVMFLASVSLNAEPAPSPPPLPSTGVAPTAAPRDEACWRRCDSQYAIDMEDAHVGYLRALQRALSDLTDCSYRCGNSDFACMGVCMQNYTTESKRLEKWRETEFLKAEKSRTTCIKGCSP